MSIHLKSVSGVSVSFSKLPLHSTVLYCFSSFVNRTKIMSVDDKFFCGSEGSEVTMLKCMVRNYHGEINNLQCFDMLVGQQEGIWHVESPALAIFKSFLLE